MCGIATNGYDFGQSGDDANTTWTPRGGIMEDGAGTRGLASPYQLTGACVMRHWRVPALFAALGALAGLLLGTVGNIEWLKLHLLWTLGFVPLGLLACAAVWWSMRLRALPQTITFAVGAVACAFPAILKAARGVRPDEVWLAVLLAVEVALVIAPLLTKLLPAEG
jgi:hypothetical protein